MDRLILKQPELIIFVKYVFFFFGFLILFVKCDFCFVFKLLKTPQSFEIPYHILHASSSTLQ